MKTRINPILSGILAIVILSSVQAYSQNTDAVKNVPVNTPGDITGADKSGDVSSVTDTNDSTGDTRTGTVTRKEAVNPPQVNGKTARKEIPQVNAPADTQANRNPDDKGVNPDLLLPIEEGNYKYSRIPGIQLKENKGASGDDIIQSSGKNEADSSKGKITGLFGMSKSASDTLIKIFIILFVVSIFILYRIRSGRSNRRVFKSYRK